MEFLNEFCSSGNENFKISEKSRETSVTICCPVLSAPSIVTESNDRFPAIVSKLITTEREAFSICALKLIADGKLVFCIILQHTIRKNRHILLPDVKVRLTSTVPVSLLN
jgi:cell fate regulator YaaT (PSP1 superfamily)